MTQKCDGVKILDLEEKLEATGGEYIVTAEKDNNYKLPLESVADIVIGSSKFKAAIKDVYESSTPTASVSLDKDKFLFSFGIPAGRTGDAGKDGKDGKDGQDGKDGIDGVPGIDGDTTRVVIAYKSTKSIERPNTPVGGSWDYDTNTITYPEGWSGSDSNPNGYVWMSTATFSSKGTIVVPWSTPVRLTGADSSQYQNINTSDPMNTSNSFRPNFLLDFENGEAYFGAGGIHLAADADNTELELTSSDTKITLDGSGISMINNTSSGALSTVGTYIKKNNISQLTGDYQFKLDSDGMQLGQAQSPFTKWFQVSNNGSMYLNDSLTIGDTSNEHITIDSGSMKLKNSSLQNIIITYDNTTSSITLNNPTGIDSSRVVIKALDDDAEDSISVRAYDSQGNYSSIAPTGISSSNGIDKWIIINNDYIAVHTPEGSDTGWTGTKNGLRFQCDICVGTA